MEFGISSTALYERSGNVEGFLLTVKLDLNRIKIVFALCQVKEV